jgi:uncharacterized membrane protein (UPF0127 family)
VGRVTITVSRRAGEAVCADCRVARDPFSRMRGLLGRASLAEREGLFIRRTASIHTHFMRFPIDVVFVGADGTVMRIVENLRPWRMCSFRRARHVLELPAGRCARVGLRTGDRLELRDIRR